MVNFGVPYAMDGTTIPGVDLRQDSQRKTGAGSGVADSPDLKVTALSTPGAGFRVAAGGAIIQCRAAGRTRETYSLSNHSLQNYMGDGGAGVPGPASGQTRSDMVILEILDSTFAKTFTPKSEWPPNQWAKISVVQNVPATATLVDHVPALANVTAYGLARIDWTAGATSITSAMIIDIRQLQQTKTSIDGFEYSLTGSETSSVTNTSGYPNGMVWPAQANQGMSSVDIPDWATHARVNLDIKGAHFPGGDAYGDIWIQLGKTADPDKRSGKRNGWNAPDHSGDSRQSVGATATFAIPASMRGTRQGFFPFATRTGGTNATTMRADYRTSFIGTVFFERRVV